MLKKVLLLLDQEIVRQAMEAIERPYNNGDVSFEAGRRQGLHQGLLISRAKVIEVMKGDEDDEAGHGGKAVRRIG